MAVTDARELLSSATPRPWRTDVAQLGEPLVCNRDLDNIAVIQLPGKGAFDIGCGLREDAALIVAAVNNYERLLEIEAGARLFLDTWIASRGEDLEIDRLTRALSIPEAGPDG